MKMARLALVFFIFAISLATLGCDDEKSSEKPEQKQEQVTEEKKPEVKKDTKPKAEEPKEHALKIYFPNEDGTKVVAVERKVKALEKDKYKAAIEELLKGTDKKGTISIIPKKTKLKSVSLKGSKLTVDFSGDMVKYFVGGSTGEELMVGSIVNTLTEFKEVKSVKILIDGREVETIAGHMDLTMPIERIKSIL
ncbi:MAG: GerMN domain-containing protein [Selenomonadaceae bacterium]|nr:GerMN domain-containing protein [Selenomonadaceae bacterium]